MLFTTGEKGTLLRRPRTKDPLRNQTLSMSIVQSAPPTSRTPNAAGPETTAGEHLTGRKGSLRESSAFTTLLPKLLVRHPHTLVSDLSTLTHSLFTPNKVP